MTAEVATALFQEPKAVTDPRPLPVRERPKQERIPRKPRPRQERITEKPAPKPRPENPNVFLDRAKVAVVDNYNKRHDPARTPALTTELVHVEYFTITPGGWRGMMGVSVLNGLLYDVSHDNANDVTYVQVYKRVNDSKITG